MQSSVEQAGFFGGAFFMGRLTFFATRLGSGAFATSSTRGAGRSIFAAGVATTRGRGGAG